MPTTKDVEDAKDEICRILNKIGAFEFGAFKLSSGKISPYYIDLRIVPSFPEVFQRICKFYMELVEKEVSFERFERIAGIPIAGIPFASMLAYNLRKPFLYIRKGARLHGRQRRIEGVIRPGDRILLVDDLVTTGLSLAKAAKAVTSEGGIVLDAVTLLDREEGGKERLEKSGIRLHTLIRISEIAEKLHEMGVIDEDQLKTILKQIKRG